jgi:hypothetical protein
MSRNEAVFISLVMILVMGIGWFLSVRQEKEKSWFLELTTTRMQDRIELLEEYIQENDLPTPVSL